MGMQYEYNIELLVVLTLWNREWHSGYLHSESCVNELPQTDCSKAIHSLISAT